MNDSKIRSVLKEWLKAEAEENSLGIRIFYEKALANSVADVLAVTDDGIWGFEIKSDVDDLRRLQKQIDSYSLTCNRCYVVAGESKVEEAVSSVPRFCGVMKVSDNSIEIVRKAYISPKVTVKEQLKLLWPAEIRELLMFFSLPNYAQKDRDYIEERLVENVRPEFLANAVIRALMQRDYSFFEDYVQEAGLKSFFDSKEGKELFCPRVLFSRKYEKKKRDIRTETVRGHKRLQTSGRISGRRIRCRDTGACSSVHGERFVSG